LTEVEIIEGCINKNPKAEKELWEKYAPKLYGICLRHLSHPHDAEEVLQEGFIKIYAGIKSYKFTGSFEGWLKRIVINTALTHLRLTKKIKMEEDLLGIDSLLQWQVNPLVQLEAKELLRILNSLPQNLATVLNLFSIDGYSKVFSNWEFLPFISFQYSRLLKTQTLSPQILKAQTSFNQPSRFVEINDARNERFNRNLYGVQTGAKLIYHWESNLGAFIGCSASQYLSSNFNKTFYNFSMPHHFRLETGIMFNF